jgi:hypothetical protein
MQKKCVILGVDRAFAQLRKSATTRRMWRDTQIGGFLRVYEGSRASDYAARGARECSWKAWVQTFTDC